MLTRPDAVLVDLGCPDCSGVLALAARGERRLFVCRIGHAFSLESLLAAKEEQIEHMLWSAAELAEELAALNQEVVVPGEATSEDERRARERIEEVRQLGRTVRALIAQDDASRRSP